MGKATQDLRKDHETILNVLKILYKMILTNTKEDKVKLLYHDEFIYFLKIFADKYHHEKEEKFLFKELVNKGVGFEDGSIEEMLQEHILSREYMALMNRLLESKNLTEFNIVAVNYYNLLKNHIEKENNILFVIVDQLLDNSEQDDLLEKFEKNGESVIGYGAHEKLYSIIHKWATKLEV